MNNDNCQTKRVILWYIRGIKLSTAMIENYGYTTIKQSWKYLSLRHKVEPLLRFGSSSYDCYLQAINKRYTDLEQLDKEFTCNGHIYKVTEL